MVTHSPSLIEGWQETPYGHLFWADEALHYERVLARIFGYHYVQLGNPYFAGLAQFSLIPHKIFIDPNPLVVRPQSLLRGEITSLPLCTDSVDVVCLPHVLENSIEPHMVLREASRVLIPEGHLIISGFNPWSLWGRCHSMQRIFKRQGLPLLSIARVRDWLTLLDFTVGDTQTFFFRPPLKFMQIQNRLMWMEKMGKRKSMQWAGGGYVIVAKKQVRAKRGIVVTEWPKAKIWGGVGVSPSA